MAAEGRMRRVRAVLRNALVWGAVWAAAPAALFVGLRLTGVIGDSVSWHDGLGLAARFGIVGFVAGAAFSTVVGFAYRGRRLADMSWWRFGIAGGVVTAIFVPLFLQTMNLVTGGHIVPWHLVLDDSIWTGILGAVAAGGSLKFAQRSLVSRAPHSSSS
jgi:hypothetical protein